MPVTTQRAAQIYQDITSQIVYLRPPKLLMPPSMDSVYAAPGLAAGADANNIYLPQTTLCLACVDDEIVAVLLIHEISHVLLWPADAEHGHGAQFQTLVSCLSVRAGLPAFCADDVNYTQHHFSYLVRMLGIKRLQSHVHRAALDVIEHDNSASAEELAHHIFRTVSDRFADKLLQQSKLSAMLNDAAMTALLLVVAMTLSSRCWPALLYVSVCLITAGAIFCAAHRALSALWRMRVVEAEQT